MQTQLNVQMIKIADAYESPTNPRTSRDDQAFKDLVASIKEKGILVPVIVRKNPSSFSGGYVKSYEVVAGNRRLKAAAAAGLKEIPADIRELSDDEAKEIQIIENLQRADVHPLEEAEAYFKLVKTTSDIKAVAAKVGKSENYVHTRILLCNLVDDMKKAYREGVINDGHAAEIARLSPGGDQQKCFTHVKQILSYRGVYAAKDLRGWIEDNLFDELAFQPWLKDQEAMAAVGPCRECPKNTNTLFGEAKEGACTTTRCHKRKMKKYIDWMKEKTPGLVLISTEYGAGRGILGEYDWDKVAKGHKDAKPALIVEGRNRGKLIYVKVKHQPVYTMTPEEKKKHEEELEKQKIAEQKRREAELATQGRKMEGGLKNITWPAKESFLHVLFELFLWQDNNLDDVIERRKIEAKRDEFDNVINPETVLRNYYAKADNKTKAQLVMEMGLTGMWTNDRDKLLKKL